MNSSFQITTSLAFLFLFLASPYAGAQDPAEEPALTSGPAAETALTAVNCYATDGPLRGKEFDVAEKLGQSPCALLFVHELTRNTAPVLRGLDELAADFSILGFKSYTIMLSGDRTAGESQLQRVNGSLRLAHPIVLSIDGAEGPGNYALNRKAALTLVFAKDGKVTETMALTDTGPNDVPVIRKSIVALTGELPEDPGELKKLVAASLPADSEELKNLAAEQTLELKRLRAQIANLQQQVRAGMNRPAPQRRMQEGQGEGQGQPPRRRVPDPNATTTLNASNLTAQDVAELYFKYTGKRVVVGEEAARRELSLIVPGEMTYAQAATIIEKKIAMEGLALVPDDNNANLLELVVADSSLARKVLGGREEPPRVRRIPNPPPGTERPQRQGRPPEDPELNTLLRSFIRQTNDQARADEVFADIKKRSGTSEELKTEAVEMFKLMLSFPDRYGTEHAQKLAKSFLEEHAPAQKEE